MDHFQPLPSCPPQLRPVSPTDPRAWAEGVRDLVRLTDAAAELCLCGDEWLVETVSGDSRLVLGVRVVRLDSLY